MENKKKNILAPLTQDEKDKIDRLPQWKQDWVKEAAAPVVREYFLNVTKPAWKAVDNKIKSVNDRTAREAGFADYNEVKQHLEWIKVGMSATDGLGERLKKFTDAIPARLKELLEEKNALTNSQEIFEYRIRGQKADLLEKYITHAIKHVNQILANGRLIMECDIDGIDKGMIVRVPEALAKALKAGTPKNEVAGEIFSGTLLALDKYRTVILEHGQVLDGYVNDIPGTNHYDHSYCLQNRNGEYFVLDKAPENNVYSVNLFTDTPISFNGEKELKVAAMRPKVELERVTNVKVTIDKKPHIRCCIDGVQQMREQMTKEDKALYANAKTVFGKDAAEKVGRMLAEKYYSESLGIDRTITMKR